MNKDLVRIQKTELNSFKNVGKGSVKFKQNPKNIEGYIPSAEVLGIYG